MGHRLRVINPFTYSYKKSHIPVFYCEADILYSLLDQDVHIYIDFSTNFMAFGLIIVFLEQLYCELGATFS